MLRSRYHPLLSVYHQCRRTILLVLLPFVSLGRRLRYTITHTPRILMVQLPQEITTMWSNVNIRYMSQISNIILAVGLGVGLYNRWISSAQYAILLVAMLGLLVFVAASVLYYYSFQTFGLCLARLWVGCLLGVIAFSEDKENTDTEDVMNVFLIGSLITRCVWCIVERVIDLEKSFTMSSLLSKLEVLEVLGMAAASFMLNTQVLSISLLLLALTITVTVIRLRSMLAVLNLLVIILLSSVIYFPRVLELPVNSAALICFVGRLSFEPLIDLFCCRLSLLERWSPILQSPSFLRKIFLLLLVCVQLTFLGVSAKLMPSHKEWFIVVPLFVACSAVWLGFHALFLASFWQLMNKISDCNLTYMSLADDQRDMLQIMSSHGVRHLALIVQRLTAMTLITSLIIGAISWTTKTGVSMGLLLVVVPLESAALSLLREMGRALGGTCVGYALVAPTIQHRLETRHISESWTDGSPALLATDAMQEAGAKVTRLLNVIQHFFARQLVSTYGCDYSSSGVTRDSVQAKITGFFQQKTSDGPRFDSYLLYYSGEVMDNGDWALSDSDTLKLDTLLDWWREQNTHNASRLILILDTRQSHRWLKGVQNIDTDYVALQTCHIAYSRDLEMGVRSFVGDFTMQWVRYNCTRAESRDNAAVSGWNLKDSVVKPVYSVSRCWTDFTFRLPTQEDISKQCESGWLKFTKPLIKFTNISPFKKLHCIDCVLSCLRRKRMRWFKPLELHIGHGFKLLRV